MVLRGWRLGARAQGGYAGCCSPLQEGFMTNLVFAIIVGSVLAVNGCVANEEPAGAATTEGVAIGELTAPAGEASALQQFCFTCDLDPSVRACSSIASRAQHICQRACVVCDDFGDNIGDCFIGQCEPDFP
jgi:hypothetical protein